MNVFLLADKFDYRLLIVLIFLVVLVFWVVGKGEEGFTFVDG